MGRVDESFQAVRPGAQRVVIWATSALLLIAFIAQIRARKPPYFARPRTIVDHSMSGSMQRVLTMLQHASTAVPRGARVTCFHPAGGGPHEEPLTYLTSVGMLPALIALPAGFAAEEMSDDQRAEYVIAVDDPFTQTRYEEIASFPEGRIYRLKR